MYVIPDTAFVQDVSNDCFQILYSHIPVFQRGPPCCTGEWGDVLGDIGLRGRTSEPCLDVCPEALSEFCDQQMVRVLFKDTGCEVRLWPELFPVAASAGLTINYLWPCRASLLIMRFSTFWIVSQSLAFTSHPSTSFSRRVSKSSLDLSDSHPYIYIIIE